MFALKMIPKIVSLNHLQNLCKTVKRSLASVAFYSQDCFSCRPNVAAALLALLVGIWGMIAGWVHLCLCTIFLEGTEKERREKSVPASSTLATMRDVSRGNARTSTGTADVCMCAYCGIYAPCIAVLAAINCRTKEGETVRYRTCNMVVVGSRIKAS